MTRVLLLSPTAVPGGAERALANLALHLPGHGYQVSAVLLTDGPLRTWLSRAGCPVVILPAGRTRYLHQTMSVIRQLARFARDSDIMVSNQSKGHVLGGLAAALARRPEIWWQHGTPARSRIEMIASVVPSRTVVCSSREAASAQRRMTPHRSVEKIHPGVEVEAIAARNGSGIGVRESLGWRDNQVVGIVGRLQPWKGQETFLRAAALVAERFPLTRFAVVGGAVLGWEGDYPLQLESLATDLGIADIVFFAGHQEDPYPWFDAMDVVVHASLGEPFGLVLVEAMSLGKPVIATAAGGPLEIIDDGNSGLLVQQGDVSAMAAAMCRLLGDPALALRLSLGARQRASTFSASAMAQEFVALFDQICLDSSN